MKGEVPAAQVPPEAATARAGKRLIHVGIVAFLLTCALLFAFSGLLAPGGGSSEPRFAIDETARASADGTFQVTLDASDRKHWVHFDLAGGRITTVAPEPQAQVMADLVVWRHVLGAPHGAIKLGKVPLASARLPASPSWERDALKSGKLQNAALAHWYGYSYTTHVLRSAGETYAVRLTGGGIAYLNVVSYYCKPEGAGCMTIRYRLELEGS